MKPNKDILSKLTIPLPADENKQVAWIAERTGTLVEDIIDYSERNWNEDKFRFNDEDETLEEIYIDFHHKNGSSAQIIFCKYDYLDLATALMLNAEEKPSVIPDKVWMYLEDKMLFLPRVAELCDEDFPEAEKLFDNFNPDFKNIDSEGIAFTKDHIKVITEHLSELGYFLSRKP